MAVMHGFTKRWPGFIGKDSRMNNSFNYSLHLLRFCYVQTTLLSTLHVLTYFIPTTVCGIGGLLSSGWWGQREIERLRVLPKFLIYVAKLGVEPSYPVIGPVTSALLKIDFFRHLWHLIWCWLIRGCLFYYT